MVSYIRQNFVEIDKDKNNMVSLNELKENLEDNGIEFEGDIKQFFETIDVDKDGELSMNEIYDQSL